MNLQDIFYAVAIITMSLITVFLLGLVIAAFYIRIKIGEVADAVRDVLKDTKRIVANPQRIASTLGEAVVDTAVNQVEKIIKPKPKSRRVR